MEVLMVVLIDFVVKKDEKSYPEGFLKECK